MQPHSPQYLGLLGSVGVRNELNLLGAALHRVQKLLGISRTETGRRTTLGGVLPLCALIATAGLTPFTLHAASDVAPPPIDHTLTGWIQSPLLNRKRDFTDAGAAGAREVLANEIDRRQQEIMPEGDPVAEGVLDGAIRFRIYSCPDQPACLVTAIKLKEDPLWPEIPVGQQLTFVQADLKFKHSGQRVDLAMDIATIAFKQSELDLPPDAVLPSTIARYLRDQQGTGTVHAAAHWRLIDRGLGWPAGEFGHAMTLAVVHELQDACATPNTPGGPGGPSLRGHALKHLVELAKIDGSPDVQEALAQTRRDLRERGEYFGGISDESAGPPRSHGPAGATNRAPAATQRYTTPSP